MASCTDGTVRARGWQYNARDAPAPRRALLRRTGARARPPRHRALRPAGLRTHDARGPRDAQCAAPALAGRAVARRAAAGRATTAATVTCVARIARAQGLARARRRHRRSRRPAGRCAPCVRRIRRGGRARRAVAAARWCAPATSSSMRSSARVSTRDVDRPAGRMHRRPSTRRTARSSRVDIPSGLHADTGHVLGVAVRADLTVTFIGRKLGCYLGAGPDHAGHDRVRRSRACRSAPTPRRRPA